jgi:hypothetical protein
VRTDDLEYLPSGDAALTRRAAKYSGRTAVVVRFSRSRGRYERQGILVERAGLEKADQECTADADERAAARARGAMQRREQDCELVARMTKQIVTLFPGCPPRDAAAIAQHTAVRSGRVGRTAAGRNLRRRWLRPLPLWFIAKHTQYDATGGWWIALSPGNRLIRCERFLQPEAEGVARARNVLARSVTRVG